MYPRDKLKFWLVFGDLDPIFKVTEGVDDLQFYVISTVFQSYQDNESLIIKGCVQWNLVYG